LPSKITHGTYGPRASSGRSLLKVQRRQPVLTSTMRYLSRAFKVAATFSELPDRLGPSRRA
jgi:hypothetical protein